MWKTDGERTLAVERPLLTNICHRKTIAFSNAITYRLGEIMEMTLTAKGQFTFNKSLMNHLGIQPGEKISIEKRIDGTLCIKPSRNRVSAKSLMGIIQTDIQASDEEIKRAIETAHATAGMKGLSK